MSALLWNILGHVFLVIALVYLIVMPDGEQYEPATYMLCLCIYAEIKAVQAGKTK